MEGRLVKTMEEKRNMTNDVPKLEVRRLVRLRDGDGKLRAMADVAVAGHYMLRGVRVVEGPNGPFVSMPGRRDEKGIYRDRFHPISKEARKALEGAVLQAFRGSERIRLAFDGK